MADGQIGFYGLERLVPSGGTGGGSALPAVDIRDGRILIRTSAGEVSASVLASGLFPKDATASIVLDPAIWTSPQDTFAGLAVLQILLRGTASWKAS